MKIEKLNDDKLIVFLNNYYLKKNNISLKNNLEKHFKNLFMILNDCYDIEIKGFYNITIYQDYLFGIVLEMEKEELDFYSFYDDHIDMKIKIMKKEKFVFCVDKFALLDNKLLKECKLGVYKNKFYIIPKRTITEINKGFILENTQMIYGDLAYKILNTITIFNSKKVFV